MTRVQPRKTSRRAIAVALGLVTLLATACSGNSGNSAAKKNSSGTYSFSVLESTPGFFDLPLHVAIDDFATQNHLKLSIQTVNGGGTLATEFQGGTGTVAMVGVDTPFRLQNNKGVAGGVSIIGTNMTHMLYALVSKAGSKYTSLASLKGANVAVTGAGAASQVVLQWALITQAHMQPSDIHIVPLGSPPTILAGVQKGSVAAGTVFSPALDQGLADKSVQIAYDFRSNSYAQNVFMARTTQLKADQAPYTNFMKAYQEAVSKLESNPTFAMQAAQKYWGQGSTPALLKAELDFYMNDEWKGTDFPQSLYQSSRDVLLNAQSGFTASTFPSYEEMTNGAPSSTTQ